MTSNEGRHEVAERLRREAERWRTYFGSYTILDMPDHIFTDSVLEAFGFGPDDMGMSVYRAFYKMADTMDRPTCRNLAVKPADEFLCSKCGEHVDIAYMDSCDDYHAKYCPNCGAVIADD